MILLRARMNHNQVGRLAFLCGTGALHAISVLFCGELLAPLGVQQLHACPRVFGFQQHVLKVVLVSRSLARYHFQ